MKRFAVLLAFLMYAAFGLQAQGVQISGNVTGSEDGAALPGVSVVVKGTTVGTVTDVNGDYSVISAFRGNHSRLYLRGNESGGSSNQRQDRD